MAISVSPTYPGVYINETAPAIHGIQAATTHVTAFLGVFPQGPTDQAWPVSSWTEFESQFGPLTSGSLLASYAVWQFFQNGGDQAWIVRLKGAIPATAEIPTGLTLAAKQPGAAANQWSAQLSGTGKTLTFTLYPKPGGQGTPVETPVKNLDPTDPAALALAITSGSTNVTAEAASGASLAAGNAVDFSGGSADLQAAATAGPVTVTAKQPGSWANGLIAVLTPSSGPKSSAGRMDFSLTQITPQGPQQLESIPSLPAPDPGTLAKQLSEASDYVTASAAESTTVGPTTAAVPFAGGTPGAAATASLGLFTLAASRPGTDANSWTATLAENQKDNTKLDLTVSDGSATVATVPALPTDVQALVLAINAAAAKVTATLAAPLANGTDATWTPELFMDAVLDELGAGETVPPPVPRLDRIAPNTFNLMCIPDAAWTSGMQEAIFTPAHKFCHDRQAFLLVDPPPPRAAGAIPDALGGGPPDLRIDEVGQFQNQQKLFNRWANNVLGPNNVSGATYYPWVQIPDPANNGLPRLVPPSGTVAGLYAATDKARGVWKAPAGIAPGLANVHGLADTLDDETNGALNVQGLNCLRTFPVWQNVSWGARTLAGNDMAGSQFKYVSARRLANYIELTLKQSLKWAVFEPNEAPLWASIVAEVTPFMAGLYASGAFDGPDAKSAYFVACDATTTTEQDRLNGIVNVNVGFQPVDPAEFVVLNVQVGGLAPAASS